MNSICSKKYLVIFSLVFVFFSCKNGNNNSASTENSDVYSGSVSCRECHERFYELWASSHHGLAMQPITADFIVNKIQLTQDGILIEDALYLAVQKDTNLIFREINGNNVTDYKVTWALGGKNVYYFLTPREGGRLQTLPLAYNVNSKTWYNNPQSAVRHFPNTSGQNQEDEALSWRDLEYTFNTSCYSCHVSQLANNYNLATNTYQTNWKEPGINCETCHGPSAEHVRVTKEAGEENIPEDLKIIITKKFSPEQHNASCGSCHGKMSPISSSYMPGDKFFDNFDLITLESSDFYADGRDLGENYTMTGWEMNSCAQNSNIHCVTCHTSSGRYRFKSDDLVEANKACTICHTEKETGYEQHTHHINNKKSSPQCIDCHMPKTSFGNMVRSDHSFRPPMPAATIKFGSPNACNLCHQDKNANWADQTVKKWKSKDYQKETLVIGGLIEDARDGNWDKLDQMLKAIQTNQYGKVFTVSLIRLINSCENPKKWPVLIQALNLESPLSRSAAASSLQGYINDDTKIALFKAANDEYRLVRLAAVKSLAAFPQQNFTANQITLFQKENAEYEKSLISRPDDWGAHYNLGNHYQNLGNISEALKSYENALKIFPDAVLALVNSSLLYSISGDKIKAQNYLERALLIAPENEAANLNYALLMAEMQKLNEAEKAFKKVLEINKNNSTAAYNLSIIVSSVDLDEACTLSKQAMNSSHDDPKYAYTYAYFMNLNHHQEDAIKQLEKIIAQNPNHIASVYLLGNIYIEKNNPGKAIQIYQEAIRNINDNPQAVNQLQNEIKRIQSK
jgi:tetratricopeptide (TPR) repeat protein